MSTLPALIAVYPANVVYDGPNPDVGTDLRTPTFDNWGVTHSWPGRPTSATSTEPPSATHRVPEST